jgi:DNA polymerase
MADVRLSDMTFASLNERLGLRELLAFYADAGVDEPLNEEPVNRFAKPAVEKPAGVAAPASPEQESVAASRPVFGREKQTRETPPPRPIISTVPDEAQAGLARELASRAQTLSELREAMAAFEGCNLKSTAKNTVFAEGNPEAKLMLVGEAPGRDEDIEGRPFVGKAGELLDRMLAAIGLDRDAVYIANILPWRPPGNREPTPHETEICRPFIERQIELVNPRVLLHFGASTKMLLETSESTLRLRGTWLNYKTASGTTIPAMPTLHPTYLLTHSNHKKLAWLDLLEVKKKLAELTAAD